MGIFFATMAMVLSLYLLLLLLNIVPPIDMDMLKESFVRFIAQLAVLFYLLAAWAFWEA